MSHCQAKLFSDAAEPPVRGFLHLPRIPSGDALVLTHGAGADCQSPLLAALAQAFCESGTVVLRCDLPFRQARRHGPPPRGSAERDQHGLQRAVECLRQFAPKRLLLGGHSYGGRQASILAAREPALVHALLLLSYPLHPPKRPTELRTTHFPRLHTPVLFVHGNRDGFGSLEEMANAVKVIPAHTELLPIPSAGHELLTKQNRDELPGMIAERFAGILRD